MSAGPRLSLRTPLRTALHIGGWSCGIVLLGLMLGVVVAGPGTHRGMLAAVCIAALMNMFWGMVAGSRMVSLVATAWQLRAPHVGRQARAIGLAMLVLVVLLPAAVIALAGDRSFALAACTLAAGALAGVFWVSMPPWRIWVFIVPGVAAGLLPSSPGAPGPGSLLQPDPMATLAVALLAGTVLSCRRAMRFRGTPSACITPIALQLTRSPPFALRAAGNAGESILTPATPVGRDLQRFPHQALGIALGPGFGRNTLRNVLAAQGLVLGVVLLWLLVDMGKDMELAWAPVLAMGTALAPLARLLVLFWQPQQGLHELALLPGLPTRPAQALAMQVLRQLLARAVPALAVIGAFAVHRGAGADYLQLLLWSVPGTLALVTGWLLLFLHSAAGRWSSVALMAVLAIALPAVATAHGLAGSLPWVPVAGAAMLVAGAVLSTAAIRRMRTLPHPWLPR